MDLCRDVSSSSPTESASEAERAVDLLQVSSSEAEAEGAVVAALPAATPRATVASFGRGRQGSASDRRQLALHMRLCKKDIALKRDGNDLTQAFAAFMRSTRVAKSQRAAIHRKAGGKFVLTKARAWGKKLGKGGRRVSSLEMLDIAFSPVHQTHACALAHSWSVRWVRVVKSVTAAAYLSCQNQVLAALAKLVEHTPLVCFVSRTKFDETAQLVTLARNTSGSAEQARTSYQCMVSRMHFRFCFAGKDTIAFDLVLPPVVLLTPSADHIWNAFQGHPLLQPVLRAKTLFEELAIRAVDMYETDAAYANERMLAHVLRCGWEGAGVGRKANRFFSWMPCRCHANHIIETSTILAMGVDVLSKMYSLSLFLRSQGHFARMLKLLPQMVRQRISIKSWPPPPEAAHYRTEVLRYIASHYKRWDQAQRSTRHHWLGCLSSGSDSDGRAFDHDAHDVPPALRLFVRDLKSFAEICNGMLNNTNVLEHYCKGAVCCPGGEETTMQRMAAALRRTVFRCVPPTPASNKWAKLSGCLDIILMGIWCHAALPALFKTGLGDLTFGDLSDAHEQMDPQMLKDVAYRAVAGKRYQSARSLLTEETNVSRMLVLGIVLEGTRFLTAWFIRRAREVQACKSTPSIANMVDKGNSPVWVALQYTASLLRLAPPTQMRLQLLWRPLRCTTLEEWMDTKQQSFHDFRRPGPQLHSRVASLKWRGSDLLSHRAGAHRALLCDHTRTAIIPCAFARSLFHRGLCSSSWRACSGGTGACTKTTPGAWLQRRMSASLRTGGARWSASSSRPRPASCRKEWQGNCGSRTTSTQMISLIMRTGRGCWPSSPLQCPTKLQMSSGGTAVTAGSSTHPGKHGGQHTARTAFSEKLKCSTLRAPALPPLPAVAPACLHRRLQSWDGQERWQRVLKQPCRFHCHLLQQLPGPGLGSLPSRPSSCSGTTRWQERGQQAGLVR